MASTARGYSADPGQEFRVIVKAWNRNYVAYRTVGGDALFQRWTQSRSWFGGTRWDWADFPADEVSVQLQVFGDRSDQQGEASRIWRPETARRTHYVARNLWAAGATIKFKLDAHFSPSSPRTDWPPVPEIDAKRVVAFGWARFGDTVIHPSEPAVAE